MFTSIAIIGKPNVGKSSLFNKLVKSRHAIVSNFSGLTRDRNYDFIEISGKKALLIDTGGIAEDDSELGYQIQSQSWQAAEDSDLIIFMIDGTDEMSNDDKELLRRIRKLDKDFLTVLNKIDKKSNSNPENDLNRMGVVNYVKISTEHSINLDALKNQLKNTIKDFEDVDAENEKKIAILGRPNSGKSTFINNFINEERLIVSNQAGTTIDAIRIPFKYKGNKFCFIDTAGIRKKFKQSSNIEYFSYVKTIQASSEADIVIFMLDGNEGLVDQDIRILNILINQGKPILIAINKIDLLSKNQLSNLYKTKKMESRFIKDFIKVEISSKKRIGFNNLIKKSESIINNSRKIFSTSRLNKLLENFVNLNDLPSVNGKKIKLRYVHFGGINPTTFIVHANQDKKIPKNYIKYLEKSFRKKLNLESIQLNLIFRKSKNPFESKKNKLSNRQIKKKKRLIKFVKKTKK